MRNKSQKAQVDIAPQKPGAVGFSELIGVSKQYLPILREAQAESGLKLLAASKNWLPFGVSLNITAWDVFCGI